MFKYKKELRIIIIGLILTVLMWTIMLTVPVSASQTITVNVITVINIGVDMPTAGVAFQPRIPELINNTNGLYDVEITYVRINGTQRVPVVFNEIINAGAIVEATVVITAKEGSVFCDDLVVNRPRGNLINVTAFTNRVSDKEIIYVWERNVNNSNLMAETPPIPPTFHKITIDRPIVPTPKPTEPPELPDLSDLSEVILYAADQLIEAKDKQTAELIEAFEEQNAIIQRSIDIIIVISLVTIGAITGVCFLVTWRPTHE